jgi:hypothetical protein
MFMKIKKAHDILMNASVRKEYDSKIQARLLRKKKREEGDMSMRKMRDDLEARENAHKRQKISEEETKRRSQADLQQMREDSLRKREAQAQKRAAAAAEREENGHTTPIDDNNTKADDGAIKISWKSKKIQFTKENLETIYRAYGGLKYLIMSTTKPGRAVVAYENLADARTAMRELNHHNPYGFKCDWASGKEPEIVGSSPFPFSPQEASAAAAASAPKVDTHVADLDAFEAEVMLKMQEAARKKKAAAQQKAAAAAAAASTDADAMDTK